MTGPTTPARRWRPRVPRSRRVRANRLLWTIVGAVLLVGGLAVTAASLGWFGLDSSTAVLPASVQRRWHDWDGWASGVAIAVSLLVALLGFLLLRAELRRRAGAGLPDPVLAAPADAPPGRTRVSISALSHALTRDLQTHPGVRRAGVHLTGEPRRPEVTMRLTVTPEADITAVRGHVDAALARFETTSGWRPEVAEVTVSMPAAAGPRVH